VGFLLFTLSDVMNPAKREYSFEQWYMFYFYDLQIWEKMQKPDDYDNDDGRGMPIILSNLNMSSLSLRSYMSGSSLGATVSSMMDHSAADGQVAEVARRIAQLAKVCLF
jgi:hypothetical protein